MVPDFFFLNGPVILGQEWQMYATLSASSYPLMVAGNEENIPLR